MNFIKDDGLGFRRPLLAKNTLTVGPFIPIEIGSPRPVAGNPPGQSGLPDLPGPADEDHFIRQVFPDGVLQIAGLGQVHITPD